MKLNQKDIRKVEEVLQSQLVSDFPNVFIKSLSVFEDGRVVSSVEYGLPTLSNQTQTTLVLNYVRAFVQRGEEIHFDLLNELGNMFKPTFDKLSFKDSLKNAGFNIQDATDLSISADMFMDKTFNVINNSNPKANVVSDFEQKIDEFFIQNVGIGLAEYNENPSVRMEVRAKLF